MRKNPLLLVLTLLLSLPTLAQWQSTPCLEAKAVRIVILGSSTAAGSGPSSSDSTWVNRYRAHLQSINPNNEVINLAVGGYTTYRIMPDNFVSTIANRPAPVTTRNITKALSYNPDAIIVNMPSNDKQWPMYEQLQNFDSLYRHSIHNDVPMWICTTQPLGNATYANYQATVADSIATIYGTQSIDFWSPIVDTDSTVLDSYDSGDGVHLNDAAHGILFSQVVAEDILSQILTAGTSPDYSIHELFTTAPLCSDANMQLGVSYVNLGINDSTAPQLTINTFTNGALLQTITQNGDTLGTCSIDTIYFTLNTSNGGWYRFQTNSFHPADTTFSNDTANTRMHLVTTPQVTTLSDTGCVGNTFQIEASTTADSLAWFETATAPNTFYNGNLLNFASLNQDTTLYVQAYNGPFHYSDSLLTTDNSSTTWNGVMFSVIADSALSIDSLALKIATVGTHAVNIYTKTGTFIGYETNSAAWTYFGQSTAFVPVALEFSTISFPTIDLQQGDTLSFYLEMDNTSIGLRYQSGLSQPALRTNGVLSILTGSGVSHGFSQAYQFRDWNGKVFYHYGYKPNGTCSSDRLPVHAVVGNPEVVMPYSITLNEGDSTTLSAGPNFAAYYWNDNSTDSTLLVTENFVAQYGPYATVQVYDDYGCSDVGFTFINIIPTVGMEELNVGEMTIYPNPASITLNLQLSNENLWKGETVQLINVEGKVVEQQTIQSSVVSFDVENLPTGWYALRIDTEHATAIQPVMIAR